MSLKWHCYLRGVVLFVVYLRGRSMLSVDKKALLDMVLVSFLNELAVC